MVAHRISKPCIFSQLRTLVQKTPGWGYLGKAVVKVMVEKKAERRQQISASASIAERPLQRGRERSSLVYDAGRTAQQLRQREAPRRGMPLALVVVGVALETSRLGRLTL